MADELSDLPAWMHQPQPSRRPAEGEAPPPPPSPEVRPEAPPEPASEAQPDAQPHSVPPEPLAGPADGAAPVEVAAEFEPLPAAPEPAAAAEVPDLEVAPAPAAALDVPFEELAEGTPATDLELPPLDEVQLPPDVESPLLRAAPVDGEAPPEDQAAADSVPHDGLVPLADVHLPPDLDSPILRADPASPVESESVAIEQPDDEAAAVLAEVRASILDASQDAPAAAPEAPASPLLQPAPEALEVEPPVPEPPVPVASAPESAGTAPPPAEQAPAQPEPPLLTPLAAERLVDAPAPARPAAGRWARLAGVVGRGRKREDTAPPPPRRVEPPPPVRDVAPPPEDEPAESDDPIARRLNRVATTARQHTMVHVLRTADPGMLNAERRLDGGRLAERFGDDYARLGETDVITALDRGIRVLLAREIERSLREAVAPTLATLLDTSRQVMEWRVRDAVVASKPVLETSAMLHDPELTDVVNEMVQRIALSTVGRIGLPEALMVQLTRPDAVEGLLPALGESIAPLAERASRLIAADHFVDGDLRLRHIKLPLLPEHLAERMVAEGLTPIVDHMRRQMGDVGSLGPAEEEALTHEISAEFVANPNKLEPVELEMRGEKVSGSLTPGVAFRELRVGNAQGFEVGLALLADLYKQRVRDILYGGERSAFPALCALSGMTAGQFAAARTLLMAVERMCGLAGGGVNPVTRAALEGYLQLVQNPNIARRVIEGGQDLPDYSR
ncbi:DUF2336 domain-containing protein [Zavarzinia sp. CC-PAN008]|uniref:DUF2336 domain-containing protein n=1 Tax=Zavarzinia sp. CC-PAN008 TaxID=3243332 RepID=UPI003F745ECB